MNKPPKAYPDLAAIEKGMKLAIKPLAAGEISAWLNPASNGKCVTVKLKDITLNNYDIKEIEKKILKTQEPIESYIGITGSDYNCIQLTLYVGELKEEYLI